MATKTLKEKVIQTISNLQDESILQGLLDYIELESDLDSVYELDNSQLKEINKAKLQVNEGKTHSHNQMNKEIDEWLNK